MGGLRSNLLPKSEHSIAREPGQHEGESIIQSIFWSRCLRLCSHGSSLQMPQLLVAPDFSFQMFTYTYMLYGSKLQLLEVAFLSDLGFEVPLSRQQEKEHLPDPKSGKKVTASYGFFFALLNLRYCLTAFTRARSESAATNSQTIG